MRTMLRTLAMLVVPAAAMLAMPTDADAQYRRYGSPYYGSRYYNYGYAPRYRGYYGYRSGYYRPYGRYYGRSYYGRPYYGRSYYFSSPWGSFQYYRR